MTTQENQESEKKENSGSIYYVIPSQVFEDDRLEFSEIIFYALLSGLAFSSGYCFGSDEYLAKRMKSDPRTIRTWISHLESLGYVRRETTKDGMKWKRKIFITHSRLDSKEVYERAPTPSSNGSVDPLRKGPHARIVSKAKKRVSKQKENKEKKERQEASPPDPHNFYQRGKVCMPIERYQELQKDYSESEVDYQITQLDLNSRSNPKQFNRYADHSAVVESRILKNREGKKQWTKETKIYQKGSTNFNRDYSESATRELRFLTPDSMQTMLDEFSVGLKEIKVY